MVKLINFIIKKEHEQRNIEEEYIGQVIKVKGMQKPHIV